MMADARVAVIGGGVAGCSVAYHLTELGWSDVVVLERHELTSGTTWHAAGLCTQFSRSRNLMQLLKYSVELYQSLDAGFHRCGSLRLAESPGQLDELEHVGGIARLVGVPFEVVSVGRAQELFPLLETRGVTGAAYLPSDGHVDPARLTNALAQRAAAAGARILRRSPVTAIERQAGWWRLETPHGSVRAEIVVDAAGLWAPQIARLAGADLPILALQHQYVLTEPMDEVRALASELPVLRDPRHSFYARQDGDGLLVGCFERNPKPLHRLPKGFHSRLLPPDLGRILDVLGGAAERIPALGKAAVTRTINGPDGYTPDGRCLMGPVPGLRDFHVLAGFSIFGIVFAGGAGRYAAEWIVEGQPSNSMWELDVRRFGDYARARSYLVARACETYEREYAVHYPEEERPAGRPLKTSPLYDRLRAKGAVFGARSGWERPLWFAKGVPAEDECSFRRSNWFLPVGEECRAVRSAVGVLDQTSFSKLMVSGPGAEAALDRLCANRLPERAGAVRLTQMLTPKGGIECDVTVTRLADDRFYVVSAAAAEAHDLDWIQRNLPPDGSVRVESVTATYGVLTLAGPRSRELLQRLTDDDVSGEAFPFFTARRLVVGMAPVLALRVSYVGELGFELHHPIEYQRHLYDLLFDAGEDLGLVDFGYRALESLRLEKGYRLWGADISADYTPLEAGLERFVAFDKGDFIGRQALLRQREAGGPRIRLSCLTVEVEDADAHGGEPVYADDRPVSYVVAGGYGHTVGESIALAYLPRGLAMGGTELQVEILGRRCPARLAEMPLYDPAGERLRS
jgi:dimethylglycine dehydrogenase